jgi:hypothetical protein
MRSYDKSKQIKPEQYMIGNAENSVDNIAIDFNEKRKRKKCLMNLFFLQNLSWPISSMKEAIENRINR